MCFLIYPFFPLTIHSWEPNQRYFLTYYKYLWFFFQRWKTGMKWTPKKQLELIFVKIVRNYVIQGLSVCLSVNWQYSNVTMFHFWLTLQRADFIPGFDLRPVWEAWGGGDAWPDTGGAAGPSSGIDWDIVMCPSFPLLWIFNLVAPQYCCVHDINKI